MSHDVIKIYCQNLPLVMFNNFTYYIYFVESSEVSQKAM